MGNASSEVQSSVEEITDENWSKQLEKYLEIENADVQADLIYLFDGKAVSGPAQNDPLRCRQTGRHLQHGSFTHVVKMGGLTCLPILRYQGASIRTGELAWLDRNRFSVSFDVFTIPRTRKEKEKNSRRSLIVGGRNFPWLTVDTVSPYGEHEKNKEEERCANDIGYSYSCMKRGSRNHMNKIICSKKRDGDRETKYREREEAERRAADKLGSAKRTGNRAKPDDIDFEEETLRICLNHLGVHFNCFDEHGNPAVLPSNKWNHLVLSVDYQDPLKLYSPKRKDQNTSKGSAMNSSGKSENDAVIEEVSDVIPSSTSNDYSEENEEKIPSLISITDLPSNSKYIGNRKLLKIESTEVMRRIEFERRLTDSGKSDRSVEERKEKDSQSSFKEKEFEKENEEEKEREPVVPGYSVRVALNGVPLSCKEYCTFTVKGSKYVSEFNSMASKGLRNNDSNTSYNSDWSTKSDEDFSSNMNANAIALSVIDTSGIHGNLMNLNSNFLPKSSQTVGPNNMTNNNSLNSYVVPKSLHSSYFNNSGSIVADLDEKYSKASLGSQENLKKVELEKEELLRALNEKIQIKRIMEIERIKNLKSATLSPPKEKGQNLELSPNKVVVVKKERKVNRELSFGFYDNLSNSCFNGYVRSFRVYSHPPRLLSETGIKVKKEKKREEESRRLSQIECSTNTVNLILNDTDNGRMTVNGMIGKDSSLKGDCMNIINRRDDSLELLDRNSATLRTDNNMGSAESNITENTENNLTEVKAADPFGMSIHRNSGTSDSAKLRKALGHITTKNAVYAVLHDLPINRITLTNTTGHTGQYRGKLINQWSCCGSSDFDSVGCGRYHPGAFVKTARNNNDLNIDQIRERGGLLNSNSKNDSNPSSAPNGCLSSTSSTSSFSTTGTTSNSSSSSDDVFCDRSNTYSCCERMNKGCMAGPITHHPSKYYRLETYNYTIKQYWACCGRRKRAGPGCRMGPHPDPFGLEGEQNTLLCEVIGHVKAVRKPVNASTIRVVRDEEGEGKEKEIENNKIIGKKDFNSDLYTQLKNTKIGVVENGTDKNILELSSPRTSPLKSEIQEIQIQIESPPNMSVDKPFLDIGKTEMASISNETSPNNMESPSRLGKSLTRKKSPLRMESDLNTKLNLIISSLTQEDIDEFDADSYLLDDNDGHASVKSKKRVVFAFDDERKREYLM